MGFQLPPSTGGCRISEPSTVVHGCFTGIPRIKLRVLKSSWLRLVGVLVEAVQTVASCEHEQIHIDFAKRVLFASWCPVSDPLFRIKLD